MSKRNKKQFDDPLDQFVFAALMLEGSARELLDYTDMGDPDAVNDALKDLREDQQIMAAAREALNSEIDEKIAALAATP